MGTRASAAPNPRLSSKVVIKNGEIRAVTGKKESYLKPWERFPLLGTTVQTIDSRGGHDIALGAAGAVAKHVSLVLIREDGSSGVVRVPGHLGRRALEWAVQFNAWAEQQRKVIIPINSGDDGVTKQYVDGISSDVASTADSEV